MVAEFGKQLDVETDKLKKDVQSFNEAKSQIQGIVESVQATKAEIDKFIVISKELKTKDFELSNFAREIFKADKEKLELLKRIDYLETLIAKMRRGNPHMGQR